MQYSVDLIAQYSATGQEMLALRLKGDSPFAGLAVSGDGRRIFAGGSAGAVTVWEAP